MGGTDRGWLAGLVNALRTLGVKMSTGENVWLVLDWDRAAPRLFFKVTGDFNPVLPLPPRWDLTDTILNVIH